MIEMVRIMATKYMRRARLVNTRGFLYLAFNNLAELNMANNIIKYIATLVGQYVEIEKPNTTHAVNRGIDVVS